MPFTGNSIRVGVTGVPGAGKSTFIESFGRLAIAEGKKWQFWRLIPVLQSIKEVFWG
jgi:GTPase involved in cell partitioning and DNA repair